MRYAVLAAWASNRLPIRPRTNLRPLFKELEGEFLEASETFRTVMVTGTVGVFHPLTEIAFRREFEYFWLSLTILDNKPVLSFIHQGLYELADVSRVVFFKPHDTFAGDVTFVDLSVEIGEFLAREIEHVEKPVSADLLVVDFEEGADTSQADDPEAAFDGVVPRYLAFFLLESKQAYVHEERYGEVGVCNGIARHHAVLPSPSQKVPSYAVVNLRTLDVLFSDKQRTIAGEECWLIPDKLLQCSMEASSRETFRAVVEIVEAVAEEYGQNATVVLSRAKAYAIENASEYESDDLDLGEMAAVAFESDPVIPLLEEAAQHARGTAADAAYGPRNPEEYLIGQSYRIRRAARGSRGRCPSLQGAAHRSLRGQCIRRAP